jgi:hypothetical protein
LFYNSKILTETYCNQAPIGKEVAYSVTISGTSPPPNWVNYLIGGNAAPGKFYVQLSNFVDASVKPSYRFEEMISPSLPLTSESLFSIDEVR